VIQVHLLLTRTLTPTGTVDARFDVRTWVSVARVDTVTPLTAEGKRTEHLPDQCRSVIRYLDAINGYRLLYVGDDDQELARKVSRARRGEDPLAPDFSELFGPG